MDNFHKLLDLPKNIVLFSGKQDKKGFNEDFSMKFAFISKKKFFTGFFFVLAFLILIQPVQAQEDLSLIWSYDLGGNISDLSITEDGSYIAVLSDNKIHLLNSRGVPIWMSEKVPLPDCVEISPDGSYLGVLSKLDNCVYCFNREGKFLWITEEFERIDDFGITSEGSIIVGGIRDCDIYSNYPVYFIDREGRIVWKQKAAEDGGTLSISPDSSSIAVFSYEYKQKDDDTDVERNRVYLLDSEGELINKYNADYFIEDISISSSGSYLAFCGQKHLELLGETGRSIWKYKAGKPLINVEVVSDGSVVTNTDNKVYYFDKKGNLLWSYYENNISDMTASSDGSIIVLGSDKIYFLCDAEFVEAFVEDVRSSIESKKLKGFNMSAANSLLVQAGETLNGGEFKEAFELAHEAENVSRKDVQNPFEEARNVIESEKAKGFDLSSAESLLSNAEEALNVGNYEQASEFAEQARDLALKFNAADKHVQEVRELVSSEETKDFDLSSAESLLSQAEESLIEGNYEEAFENADKAQKIVLSIEDASNFIQEVFILVEAEKLKGFDMSPAESLLSQAEKALSSGGDFERALELSNQAKFLVPDLDRDGVPNENDFAPSINNNYLYGGVGASLFIILTALGVFLGKFLKSIIEIKRIKNEEKGVKNLEVSSFEEYQEAEPEEKPEISKEDSEKFLSEYEFLDLLGEGGFARVFRVRRVRDSKIFALKLPRIDENTSSYFIKEVATWYTLNHLNIVKLYKADFNPLPYMEMEYIEGVRKNGKVIRELEKYPKPMNEDDAVEVIEGISHGLKYVHDKGIFHHDLKPLNVLLQNKNNHIIPKITDFNLARIEAKTSVTKKNAFSPLYAAPEQLDPEKYGIPDQRTDIYHLGVIFFNLLSGKLPYEGTSTAAVLSKIVSENCQSVPLSAFQPSLSHYDGVFEKLLATKMGDRYLKITEFLKDLESIRTVKKEKETLTKSLELTRKTLKISTEKAQIHKLETEIVEKTIQVLILCIKINDKAGIISSLRELSNYTEKHTEELSNAASQLEYMLKEVIPLGGTFVESLKILVYNIEQEIKNVDL